MRKTKVVRKRGSGFAYGWKVLNNQVIPHKQEQERIGKMLELRKQGFSYQKIADIFNSIDVPIKTRRAKWHSTTIIKILKAFEERKASNQPLDYDDNHKKK